MSNSIKPSKNTQITSSYPLYPPSIYSPSSVSTPSIPSISPIYATQPLPISTYLPSQSQSFINNNPISITQSLQDTSKIIPELKEFLKGLDAIYGTGKYTQYLEIFEKHDIRVNLIPKISDEWWEVKLQITSLGHILTLKEEARKYI